MDSDYAPFPEATLDEMAREFESLAGAYNGRPGGAETHRMFLERAAACRGATKSYAALRERFLLYKLRHDVHHETDPSVHVSPED